MTDTNPAKKFRRNTDSEFELNGDQVNHFPVNIDTVATCLPESEESHLKMTIDLTKDDEDTYGSSNIVNFQTGNKHESLYSEITDNAAGIYLMKTMGIPSNGNQCCVSIEDILLDPDLCDMVQFNYMVDISWLMGILSSRESIPTAKIVCGYRDKEDQQAVKLEAKLYPQITHISNPFMPFPYGTHHTKMMLLFYKTGHARIVVHTANLISCDWGFKSQTLFITPKCGKKIDSTQSVFLDEVEQYLKHYVKSIPWMTKVIQQLSTFDFSRVKAHFVASVPGRFLSNDIHSFGIGKVAAVLREAKNRQKDDIEINDQPRTVVLQCSSIGSLGKNDEYLVKVMAHASFCSDIKDHQNISTAFIFPTVENVRCSLEGYLAGGSLPFYQRNYLNQGTMMRPFLHQWRAKKMYRSNAMPHCKTYTRFRNDNELDYVVITSANVSKAAWGAFEKNGQQLFIRSFEAGVLLIPEKGTRFFASDKPYEIVKKSNEYTDIYVPLPFDLPLTKYGMKDECWVSDFNYTKPDIHGNQW